jgi:hypothetical protein
MFGAVILDMVIGLMFLYFFLGMVCSVITEAIAAKRKWRAQDLCVAIHSLLGKDEAILKRFYDSPLFLGTTPAEYLKSKTAENKTTPSYISPRSFVLALLESLKGHPKIVKIMAENKDKTFPLDSVDHIKELVQELPEKDVPVKKALLPLLETASGGDLDNAFEKIEKWYEEAMDRVSGGYKRYLQAWSLGVAFVVAMTLNVDTFAISKALYRDKSVRDSLVTMATEATKTPVPGDPKQKTELVNKYGEKLSALNLPIGWPKGIFGPQKPEKEGGGADQTADKTELQITEPQTLFAGAKDPSKLVGILFTALMVSLGANFWFDMLNKIINLRSAGKKPPTQDDQGAQQQSTK